MESVTIEQVIAWEPCGLSSNDDGVNYTPKRIERLFDGRESLTARDIAGLDIPTEDKLWALLHHEFLSDAEMHEAACHFAEMVMHLTDDPRAQAAIDMKRAWLRGEISDEELAAAGDAARAAAGAAAGDAARAAARAAARDAARAAVWAAVWDAAGAAARAAVWAAAGDTARAAARAAAGDTARAAAGATARATAEAAVWDAGGAYQVSYLVAVIESHDESDEHRSRIVDLAR